MKTEFTQNYQDFSDKMNQENQDYKDLLDRYKSHQALGSGIMGAQMMPTYGEIAQGRPHDNSIAENTGKMMTGGDISDLVGNRELVGRDENVAKMGQEAAKGNEDMRFHDMEQQWKMLMAKAAQTRADKPATKKDMNEDIVKKSITPKDLEEETKRNTPWYQGIEKFFGGHPKEYTGTDYMLGKKNQINILNDMDNLNSNNGDTSSSGADTSPPEPAAPNSPTSGVSNIIKKDVKGHPLTDNGDVLCQNTKSGQRGYVNPAMIDHSKYTVVGEGQ